MAGDGWNVMPIFYHILPLLDGFFFFFLNQQFITRHAVVDRGSDYVATYM